MAGTLVADTLQDGAGNSTAMDNAIYGSAKAWVSYNLSSQAINASYNVSSVTYNATGDFTVNFTNAFVDTNYCVTGGSSGDYSTTRGTFVCLNRIASTGAVSAPTTSSIRINVVNDAGGSYNSAYANIHVTR